MELKKTGIHDASIIRFFRKFNEIANVSRPNFTRIQPQPAIGKIWIPILMVFYSLSSLRFFSFFILVYIVLRISILA
jgi:hypothetical protein